MIDSPNRDLHRNHNRPSSTSLVEGQSLGVASRGQNSGDRSGPSELSCRRLRVRDIRFLVASARQVHLDQPDSLLSSGGPLSTGLRSLGPLRRNKPATSLAFLGDRFAGYVQFDERGPDRHWIATSVGLTGGPLDDRLVLDRLLEYSVVRAGMRSVKRLFARVPRSSTVYDAFLACGFEPYMDESIHLLDRIANRESVGVGIRDQEPADTWAVHKLYHAALPTHMQYAEAWTSHRWDMAAAKGARKIWRAYVMEDGYQVVAYAGVRCSGSSAVIESMYLTDRTQCVRPFVCGVLARIAEDGGPTRVYATAGGYQQELRTVLDDQGFQNIGTQELMIKYTTAKVVARSINASAGLPSDVLERVPKQVPTYLNRPVREETPA